MYFVGLEEMLADEVKKVQQKLNILDNDLFDEFCQLIIRHYDSFTNHEKNILCQVLCGEPLEQ